MSGFSADWLALREPADHRARSGQLREALAAFCRKRGSARLMDIGCGTGSNLRYLAGVLEAGQAWTLLDHDPVLLEVAAASAAGRWPMRTDCRGLQTLDAADFGQVDAVTGAALLDVLDAGQLDQLVAGCTQAQCAALFALSVTGRVRLAPSDPIDADIESAFNDHQRRASNGVPLLGPDAADAAAVAFGRRGYNVMRVDSPWRLGADDAALASEWLHGWVGAASEQRPERAGDFARALEARLAQAGRGELTVEVGHADLLAMPSGVPG